MARRQTARPRRVRPDLAEGSEQTAPGLHEKATCLIPSPGDSPAALRHRCTAAPLHRGNAAARPRPRSRSGCVARARDARVAWFRDCLRAWRAKALPSPTTSPLQASALKPAGTFKRFATRGRRAWQAMRSVPCPSQSAEASAGSRSWGRPRLGRRSIRKAIGRWRELPPVPERSAADAPRAHRRSSWGHGVNRGSSTPSGWCERAIETIQP